MVTPYRSLLPSTVGFDRLFSTLDEFDTLFLEGKKASTYPPYNIVKTNDTNYAIEIAIAGFSRSDLDIKTETNKLTITGSTKEVDGKEYLHRGIGTRNFTHTFTLADTVEVRGAEFKDGILRIGLENVIPDSKKPRTIEINDSIEVSSGIDRVRELISEKETVESGN